MCPLIVRKEMNAWDGRVMPRHFQEQLPSILESIIFLRNGYEILKLISDRVVKYHMLFQMFCSRRLAHLQAGQMQLLLFHGICIWHMEIRKYWRINTTA